MDIREAADGVVLAAQVHPRARRNRIVGAIAERLKIEVTAPPTQGEANEACLALLAAELRWPKWAMSIRRGQGGRLKEIAIAGMSGAELHRRLALILAERPPSA